MRQAGYSCATASHSRQQSGHVLLRYVHIDALCVHRCRRTLLNHRSHGLGKLRRKTGMHHGIYHRHTGHPRPQRQLCAFRLRPCMPRLLRSRLHHSQPDLHGTYTSVVQSLRQKLRPQQRRHCLKRGAGNTPVSLSHQLFAHAKCAGGAKLKACTFSRKGLTKAQKARQNLAAPPNIHIFAPQNYRCSNGGMVDTRDLKSLGQYRLCGFESRFEHEGTSQTGLQCPFAISLFKKINAARGHSPDKPTKH